MKRILLLSFICLLNLELFAQTKVSFPEFGLYTYLFDQNKRIEKIYQNDGLIFTMEIVQGNYRVSLTGATDEISKEFSFSADLKYRGFQYDKHRYMGTGTLTHLGLTWEGTLFVDCDEKLSVYLENYELSPSGNEIIVEDKTINFSFHSMELGDEVSPQIEYVGICPYKEATEQGVANIISIVRKGQTAEALEKRKQRWKESRIDMAPLLYEQIFSDMLAPVKQHTIEQCRKTLLDKATAYIERCIEDKSYSSSSHKKSSIRPQGMNMAIIDSTGKMTSVAYAGKLIDRDRHAIASSEEEFQGVISYEAVTLWNNWPSDERLPKAKQINTGSYRKTIIYKYNDNLFYVAQTYHELAELFKIEYEYGSFFVKYTKNGMEASNMPEQTKEWCEANISEKGIYAVVYVTINGYTICKLVRKVK